MGLAIAVARSAIAARSLRAIFGVSVANSTAVSTGPMVAKKVVKLVRAFSIMAFGAFLRFTSLGVVVSSCHRRLLTL